MTLVVRKPDFCIIMHKKKDADQITAFVFTIRIVQSLYFLNPKLQASSHLLWLYSPVCVGTGRKPRRPVFSQRLSYKRIRQLVSTIQLFCFCLFDFLHLIHLNSYGGNSNHTFYGQTLPMQLTSTECTSFS